MHNLPPEVLPLLLRAMRENSISDSELRMMVNENPGKKPDI